MTQRKRHGEILHLLVHFGNGCNSHVKPSVAASQASFRELDGEWSSCDGNWHPYGMLASQVTVYILISMYILVIIM